MAPYNDSERVLRDWRDFADPERAAFDARRKWQEILEHDDRPMRERLRGARDIAEVLFDGPGRQPELMWQLMNALAKDWRYLESAYRVSLDESVRNRVQIEVLRARAYHIGGHSRRGLEYAIAAHSQIERLAGGRERLLELLASQEPTLAAELLIAILGIFAASLKRGLPRGSEARAYWVGEIRKLATTYLSGPGVARDQVYAGASSLVQVLYLLCEEGDPGDVAIIDDLRALDIRVRPDDERARSTADLREIAVAKFRGDAASAARLSSSAKRQLQSHGMFRHLSVVCEQGYTDK